MWKIFLLSLLAFIESGLIKSNSIFDYSHSKKEPLNILAGSLSSFRAIIPFEYTKLNICHSKKICLFVNVLILFLISSYYII